MMRVMMMMMIMMMMMLVTEERTCAELSCSEQADCVTDSEGQAQCVCRRGYQGDGQTCSIIPSDCQYQLSRINLQIIIFSPLSSEDQRIRQP